MKELIYDAQTYTTTLFNKFALALLYIHAQIIQNEGKNSFEDYLS